MHTACIFFRRGEVALLVTACEVCRVISPGQKPLQEFQGSQLHNLPMFAAIFISLEVLILDCLDVAKVYAREMVLRHV